MEIMEVLVKKLVVFIVKVVHVQKMENVFVKVNTSRALSSTTPAFVFDWISDCCPPSSPC